MPRFHIHVHNKIGEVRDEEGEELADIAEAQRKAVEGVRSILSEEVLRGSLDLRGRVEIATPDGEVLLSMPFADMLQFHFDRNGHD